MLPQNVTASLDHLASLGILDYDAAAHIAGTQPRYMGSPTCYVPPTVMTPMDYTTFSYNPRYSCLGQYGQCNSQRIPWRTILGGAGILGGIYLLGKLFLAGIIGAQNFSWKGIFKGTKKVMRGIAEDMEMTAKRGGKRVKKTRKHIAKKLGIHKPWYKKAGDKIADGWKWAGKNIKKIKIR